jgi:hypothetical protein
VAEGKKGGGKGEKKGDSHQIQGIWQMVYFLFCPDMVAVAFFFFQEAANRMHVQKGVLAWLLGAKA